VDASSLPPFVTEHDTTNNRNNNDGGGNDNESNRRRDAKIISSIASASPGSSFYYLISILPGPNDPWKNMQCTVPSTALCYRPPVESAGDDPDEDVHLPPPVLAETRNDETKNSKEEEKEDGGRAPPSSTEAGAAADAAEESVRVISPQPPNTVSSRKVNDDESGSGLLPGVVPSAGAVNTANKEIAKGEDHPHDYPTRTTVRVPAPVAAVSSGQKRSRDPNELVSVGDVVRRIDIADGLDSRMVQNALIGPDRKIHQKMQAKLGAAIHVLGIGGDSTPDASTSYLESFAKLGDLSPKTGDRCVMICGDKRKVHEASKVVIHILVDKCYTGGDDNNEKEELKKELRIVRQVRKKEGLSLTISSTSSSLSSISASTDRPAVDPVNIELEQNHHPQKDQQPPPMKRQATIAAIEKAREDSGWSPSPDEPYYGPASQIPSTARLVHPTITISDSIQFNGENWVAKIRSPSGFDFFGLYDTVVPKNIKEKFGRIRVCLLGGAAHSDQDKDLPLHVHLEGPGRLSIERAAEHVTRLLVSDHHKDCEQQQEQKHLQEAPHFDGKEWVAHVSSPVGRNELFAIVIGPGAEKKKQLISRFNRCYILLVDGRSDGPPRVVIKHKDRSVVEAAASHVMTMITDYQKGGCCDIGSTRFAGTDVKDPRGPMQLLAAPMFKDELTGNWTNLIDSPLVQNDLFVLFVGQEAQKKREFEKTFRCNLWIENIGKDISSGPLRLKISAKDVPSLQIATERAASMLYEEARNKTERDMIQSLIVDHYIPKGRGWAAIIRSPVDSETLFDATIRNGKKQEIVARFGHCFISIREDAFKNRQGQNSGGALRVIVGHEHDRAAGEAAVWYVAELLHRAAAGY